MQSQVSLIEERPTEITASIRGGGPVITEAEVEVM